MGEDLFSRQATAFKSYLNQYPDETPNLSFGMCRKSLFSASRFAYIELRGTQQSRYIRTIKKIGHHMIGNVSISRQNHQYDNSVEESKNQVEESKGKINLTDKEIQSLFDEHNVGIPVDHALKLQSVASKNNTVFGIRPVEGIVRRLIEEDHPSKDMNIKGKSSNWGPQAGFICENQIFSKREALPVSEINKLNQSIRTGLNSDYASCDLKISKARISELVNLGLIETSGSGDELHIDSTAPSGCLYHFKASLNHEDGLYDISDSSGSPIKVLSDNALNKPLTADYDLFICAPSVEVFGQSGLDSRPNPSIVFSPTGKDEVGGRGISKEEFEKNHKTTKGNISPRVEAMANEINKELGRGEGLDMVHHSDESTNSSSNMADNFPSTFYLPKPLEVVLNGRDIKFNEICVINDKDEFNDLVSCIKVNGYHFTSNPIWNDTAKRPSFVSAQHFFESNTR